MARYIDADKLLNSLPDDLPYKASVKRVLIQAPTADVVPKSEVENLKDLNKQLEIDNFNANMNLDLAQQELDKLAEEYGDLITEKDELFDIAEKQMAEIEQLKIELEAMRGAANSYKMHYEKAKQEVVREIFEDIDGKMLCFFPSSSFVNAPHTTHYQLLAMLAELKKKYTESEGEE